MATITIDKSLSKTIYSPTCVFCKHLDIDKSLDNGMEDAVWVCKAFPEGGIPSPIWEGENKHTEPYKGDHGILFEKVKVEDKDGSNTGG
jgi:hypothetical protein